MKNRSGFSMIEIVVTLLIMAIVSYFILKTYFGGQPAGKDEQQNVSVDNYPNVINNAKAKAEQFNKKSMERQKELQGTEE